MPWTQKGTLRQMTIANKNAHKWNPYLVIRVGSDLYGPFGSADMSPNQHSSWWEINHGLMNVVGGINTFGGYPIHTLGVFESYNNGVISTSLPNWTDANIPPPLNFTSYRIVGRWWLDTYPGIIGGGGLCELHFESPYNSSGAINFHINRYHDSTLSRLSGGVTVPYYFDGNSKLYYNIQYEVAA